MAKTLHLRIEPNCYVPHAGEKVRMEGLAGVYLVHIKNVLERTPHADGALLMKIQGTKRLIKPQKGEN